MKGGDAGLTAFERRSLRRLAEAWNDWVSLDDRRPGT